MYPRRIKALTIAVIWQVDFKVRVVLSYGFGRCVQGSADFQPPQKNNDIIPLQISP